MSKPKVVACIIVRMASTRLPGKALADVAGKPMTLRLIERLRRAKTVDEIAICTTTRPDDETLLDLARRWGVTGVAGDEEDMIARLTKAAIETSADLLLRVTGDNVFTDPENIDRMVEAHLASGADYTRTSGLPLGMTAEVMSATMLPRLAEVIPDAASSEYLMLYAFDPSRFRCTVLDAPPEMKRMHYSVTVDTPQDLEFVSRIFLNCSNPDTGPTGLELVRILDEMPDYQGIEDSARIKLPGGETISYAELLVLLEDRKQAARTAMLEPAQAVASAG